MAASGFNRNWVTVSHASTAIKGVKNVTFAYNSTVISEGADNDAGPTHVAQTYISPVFTVETINPVTLLSISPGTRGIFTGTLLDSKNGSATGGGALVMATNALTVYDPGQIGSPFNQIASGSATFHCQLIDGVTNPVTFTPV